MKELLIIILIFITVIAGLELGGFYSFKTLGPKYEATRREIVEESKAYNDGMIRDLENLQMQYETANENQRIALKAVILHRFSVYKEENLTPSLRNFYRSLK